jgi:hypothetical protein
MLKRPDDRTVRALKAMRADADFNEFLAWLEHSLNELDRAKRATMDGVLLRQQQGGAQVIAEIVDYARGTTKAIAAVNTRAG